MKPDMDVENSANESIVVPKYNFEQMLEAAL